MKSMIVIFIISLLSGCDFLSQDKCLDGGGRWNKEEHRCEYAEGDASIKNQ